jgi:diguanylate cyclase (GGDEF)-like protein
LGARRRQEQQVHDDRVRGRPAWLYGVAIVAAVVVGFAGTAFIVALRVYDQALARARSDLDATARSASRSVDDSLTGTLSTVDQLLRGMRVAEVVSDRAACRTVLEPIAGLVEESYVAIVDGEGSIACHVGTIEEPPPPLVDAWRRARTTGEPSLAALSTGIFRTPGALAIVVPLRAGAPERGLFAAAAPSTLLFGSNLLHSPTPSKRYVIADARGGVVATNERIPEGTSVRFKGHGSGTWTGLDGIRRVYRSRTIGNSGLRIFVGIPERELFVQAREVLTSLIPVVAVALIVVIAATILLVVRITRPIGRFTAIVERAGTRNLAEPLRTRGPRELQRLAASYNDMFDERLRYEEQLEHRAIHDELTGLPNRALLIDRLDHALRRATREGARTAVLFCDLDRFKVVNDSLGHQAGDLVLEAVARRFERSSRSGDTVARFGGDEFVILREDIADDEDAELAAEMLLTSLAGPIDIDGHEVSVSCSIGVVVAEAETEPETVVRDADTAMYSVKARGGGGYELFRPELHLWAQERWEVERDLRRALNHDELTVWYQAQVDVETGEVVGVEALVRWQHPERGLVAPATFLLIAEETGLIRDVGRYVLGEACRQGALWEREGFHPRVAVNLSAREVDPDLPSTVDAILDDSGFDPSRLCLELTEHAFVDPKPENLEALQRVRAKGVTIALDDFGVGYSSFGTLRSLPVDALKIDRSLVVDIEHRGTAAIASAIIELSRSLGLDAVAEGVESDDQLTVLHTMGCRYVQGFLFARPAPPDHLPRRVDVIDLRDPSL